MTHTGGCYCGAVRYETGALSSVVYCHCSKCRRWHGHFGAYTGTDRVHFKVTEARGLKWHQVSDVVRRGFCGECGSSLFFDEQREPMGISPGTLDEPTRIKSKAHIFVGSKSDYYELPNDGLKRYEEGD